MNHPPLSNDPEQLRAALRELEESEESIETLLPILQHMDQTAVLLNPLAAEKLLKKLLPLLPSPHSVRRIIAQRHTSPWFRLYYFLEVALSQVNLFRLDFWLLSAGITLLGGFLTLGSAALSTVTSLWLVSPILAVLGVYSGFQSSMYRVEELENACPISPLRLALARLLIILGYDGLLLGGLSLVLARLTGSGLFGGLIIHWLAPLVLVTGLSLVASLRFSLRVALTLAYAVWMTFVSLSTSGLAFVSPQPLEGSLLLMGLACLAIALRKQGRAAA